MDQKEFCLALLTTRQKFLGNLAARIHNLFCQAVGYPNFGTDKVPFPAAREAADFMPAVYDAINHGIKIDFLQNGTKVQTDQEFIEEMQKCLNERPPDPLRKPSRKKADAFLRTFTKIKPYPVNYPYTSLAEINASAIDFKEFESMALVLQELDKIHRYYGKTIDDCAEFETHQERICEFILSAQEVGDRLSDVASRFIGYWSAPEVYKKSPTQAKRRQGKKNKGTQELEAKLRRGREKSKNNAFHKVKGLNAFFNSELRELVSKGKHIKKEHMDGWVSFTGKSETLIRRKAKEIARKMLMERENRKK